MHWDWVDIAIVCIIALSVLTGLIRGFIKELIALGVWLLAILVAYHYAYTLDPWLHKYLQDKQMRLVVAFIMVFLAVVIGGGIVNAILGLILRGSGLSGIDRILGMGFGLVRGIFIVSLIIVVIKMTSLPYKEYFHNSQLYARFDPVVNWLSTWVPPFISQAKMLDYKTINDKDKKSDKESDKKNIIDVPDIKKAIDNKQKNQSFIEDPAMDEADGYWTLDKTA